MFRVVDPDAVALQPTSTERLTADGYLPLPGLITADGLALLRREAAGLEALARRRDFSMACMDDSPRHMTTLGGQIIGEASEEIPALYQDSDLLELVSRLAGEPVSEVDDPVERHVLNILHREGDTHGAHTDDHPYALVLFLEAPDDPADGGLVHFLPHAGALRDLDTADDARTAHHRAGDAYLLRSDTTAHRVTPLTRPGLRRTVLNFAYTTPASRPHSTGSAAELYT
ncbi:HalD/BesD family halogenase [Streptomyces omiyaensis]|uniref:HalD/BesD family halogenase n=1 Tax=Streptomyces omiyaensis TaxID=68247 RepID=UPI003700AE8C